MARSKSSNSGSKNGAEESTAAFFRGVFRTHRNLLRNRSNQRVLKLWLEAHPDHEAVPKNIQNAMANVKSVMRSKMRGYKKQTTGGAASGTPKKRTRASEAALERLEILIDECVTTATTLDREGLANVIKALRIARRRVVWKLGVEE